MSAPCYRGILTWNNNNLLRQGGGQARESNDGKVEEAVDRSHIEKGKTTPLEIVSRIWTHYPRMFGDEWFVLELGGIGQ